MAQRSIAAGLGLAALMVGIGNVGGVCLASIGLASPAQEPPLAQVRPLESGASKRFWELGVYYPAQFYSTSNAVGTSNAYTAVGFGVLVNRTIAYGIGIMAGYQVDLNAQTSAAIFSGGNLGLSYVIWGQDDLLHTSPSLALRRRPMARSLLFAGVGQRTFDFRSLITQEQVDIARSRDLVLELEGSGWAPFVRLQFDTRVLGTARVGTFVQYQSVLAAPRQRTTIQSYTVGMTYDFSRLTGAD
jgi:hypothetical protein